MQFKKKHCVAMLLAGGQGSRLKILTENTAKPAVPFGGKYRIIDFSLSNCVNSDIDTVGILTQYQPLELNEYIGNGQPWRLNSSHGGAMPLPPYAGLKGAEWYKGTANAISQNISFVERYHPDNVLILSGDHIYKMNYEKMLRFHEEKEADCTIAARTVPLEEASRFGIMNTEADGRIYEFEEKPPHPKNDQASMGIYIFRWSVLKQYLLADEQDPDSENDFGKNIIPAILNAKLRVFAYPFRGYWRDVGTINSLWEANMDTLGSDPAFDLQSERGGKIYARNTALPATCFAKTAEVSDSNVAEGCEVAGKIRHSVISTGCVIGEGALVADSVIMPNVTVEPGAVIRHAIVAEECVIGAGSVVGEDQTGDPMERKIAVIGKEKHIEPGQIVQPGAIV